ncbi:hypothetical protein Trco_006140 [Trichoderma cornu-damae]|uniref:Uncharacterized protein n=1 Tax=Trichoderma cornu-damae TaxID=654480 RepID=A0A9P8QR52_9HYPO|nr:hypothetical protein Trco_006140 [Trichoderma cornu-damae]
MPLLSISTASTPVPDQGMQGTLACCATIVEEILSPNDRMADPGGPMKTIFLDGMDVHALGNVHNQLDVGIVVVICAAGDLDVVVRHSNVVGVGL